MLCSFFCAEATIFKKKCPWEVKYSNWFFSLLPKWPKQKNSCSKMWLIDQLYIKLGIKYCLLFLKGPLYLRTSRNFHDDVRLSDSYHFFFIWIGFKYVICLESFVKWSLDLENCFMNLKYRRCEYSDIH